MLLEEIQDYLVDRLANAPALVDVPVIAEDGTYPKTPTRAQHLRDTGLVLIVWQIESDGLVDATSGGIALHDVYLPVVIEENPAVCRADGGLGITAEKALRFVLGIVPGKPPGHMRSTNSIEVHDPPFQNFGTIEGVRRIVANFVLRNEAIVAPT